MRLYTRKMGTPTYEVDEEENDAIVNYLPSVAIILNPY